jgi:alkanesulfonate monooxygenase SsuD/methylene tetrahydromethanopterin reductase-like flavin-dependent oxidoreductase (luciferase family)
MKFGLILPHFGPQASREEILNAVQKAENYGLDSVWVRDHLVFTPHGMEPSDRTFIDGYATMAFVAAATRRVTLGTAATIPLRHPVYLAHLAASIVNLAERPLILGIGAGFRDSEFAAVGWHTTLKERAQEIIPETVEILNMLWQGKGRDYQGKHFHFEDVEIFPKPKYPVYFRFCGSSPLSIRLGVDHCQGWVPGRITIDTLQKRVSYIQEYAGGWPEGFGLTVIPITSVAKTHEEAFRGIDVPALLEYANKHRWIDNPPSGEFKKPEDLSGLLLAGTPDEICETLVKYQDNRVTDVVFDFRQTMDKLDDSLTILGEDVIPRFKDAVS